MRSTLALLFLIPLKIAILLQIGVVFIFTLALTEIGIESVFSTIDDDFENYETKRIDVDKDEKYLPSASELNDYEAVSFTYLARSRTAPSYESIFLCLQYNNENYLLEKEKIILMHESVEEENVNFPTEQFIYNGYTFLVMYFKEDSMCCGIGFFAGYNDSENRIVYCFHERALCDFLVTDMDLDADTNFIEDWFIWKDIGQEDFDNVTFVRR